MTLSKRVNRVISLLSNALRNKQQICPEPAPQPCFKIGSGEQKYPYSICFYLDGEETIKSIGYAHLMHMHYNRQAGIILFYIDSTVTIYGKNLDQLHECLAQREITSISVFDNNSLQGVGLDKEVAIVTEINVAYKDKDIEQEIEEALEHAYSKKGNSTPQR